jgi:benzoate membrane transport protein
MAAAYVAGRRFWPRANIPLVLVLGIAIAAAQGLLHLEAVPWKITTPVWTSPAWSLPALIGTGIPLFIVTMASQNLPGIAAIRVGGYEAPVSKIIGWTGVTTFLFAPFGAFGINLAAITAAFCVGPEAHPDPARRYWAPLSAAFFYLLVGIFGATVAGLFAAFPRELVLAIAGLALLTTIGNALAAALHEERYREAAAMTFFVTLSGITLLGIGAAFWGVVAGGVVLALHRNP